MAGTSTLLCFGYGYSARALAKHLIPAGWRIIGTCRREEAAALIEADGAEPVAIDQVDPAQANHILISVPPGSDGDPVLNAFGAVMSETGSAWLGYLSTTGVYGDTGGREVNETSPLNPASDRSARRVEAEAGWLSLEGVPAHIFRLAGIYGPGRSALDQIKAGRARRIDKPGFTFSRIHVEDIAGVLAASIAAPNPGAIYNVCDNEPAPQADVIAYGCELLGADVPPLIPYDAAQRDMTEMARSFWQDNRRVSNARIRDELGYRLIYPSYREGLQAIHLTEGGLSH